MAHRVPQPDGSFHGYINSTAIYLAAGSPPTMNDVRLGLTPAQSSQWQTRRTNWNLIYAKYEDPLQRTKAVTAEKNAQKKAFTAFAIPILTAISVSPALTQDDRVAFNLPERDAPSERVKIQTAPYGQLLAQDGGSMKVRVRTTSDGNRASMHPDSDHVEMRYALVAVAVAQPDPMQPPSPTNPATGVAGPATAAECPLSAISTKAQFLVDLGQESSGKRLFAYFRWVNAVKPALSSPWSTVQQSVVL